jgi:hypothetical protein
MKEGHKILCLSDAKLANVCFKDASVVFHPVGGPEHAHAAGEKDKNFGGLQFGGLTDAQHKECQ